MEPIAASFEDKIRAENEVLRLKLELDYQAVTEISHDLSARDENRVLKFMYQHAELSKNSDSIKVYDFINRPAFKPVGDLSSLEVTTELARLEEILDENGIQLDILATYDDTVIYKFITEELFDKEIQNFRIPGMVCHFIYEEFHMNLAYDTERIGKDLLKSIFQHEWRSEYDGLWLNKTFLCNGAEIPLLRFSQAVLDFQSRFAYMELVDINISEIKTSPDNTTSVMRGTLSCRIRPHGGELSVVHGPFSIATEVSPEDSFAHITAVEVPYLMVPT